MCTRLFAAAVLLFSALNLFAAKKFVVPTTTLAAQTGNNTSAANSFISQKNGNQGAGNVSKVDVHSLLYPGATTKVYAHLMVWFGKSNHMNVGYSSTDPAQVHRQITDMISRGIEGVIIDWYGPGNSEDDATRLVMAEAETHPGFTFAIMIDQGAIKWDSCSGCTPQEALINQLQYIEQTYFSSPAYMTREGRPVVTNFDIDRSFSIDWKAVNAALSSQPIFLFQNNSGFSHVLSGGSYSWVMPTTSNYGLQYLASFYQAGIPFTTEETVGATYKGFNDSLASWGSGRIMNQQCAQTWLNTFSEINSLYNSGKPLPTLQLVTWNDYEEGTEIESGISNCMTVSAQVGSNTLRWTANGNRNTLDHYVVYISTDGKNLMPLTALETSVNSADLCGYSIPTGNYTLYVQAVGRPNIANAISGPVQFAPQCGSTSGSTLNFGASPASLTISAGGSGTAEITAQPKTGSFNNAIALACNEGSHPLTCTFSPASITPGSRAVSSVLTISDAGIATRTAPMPRSFLLATFLLFPGIVVVGGAMRRKHSAVVLGTLALATMVAVSTSCGGISASKMGSPGMYTVTVSGTSGAVQVSTTVTVTVD